MKTSHQPPACFSLRDRHRLLTLLFLQSSRAGARDLLVGGRKLSSACLSLERALLLLFWSPGKPSPSSGQQATAPAVTPSPRLQPAPRPPAALSRWRRENRTACVTSARAQCFRTNPVLLVSAAPSPSSRSCFLLIWGLLPERRLPRASWIPPWSKATKDSTPRAVITRCREPSFLPRGDPGVARHWGPAVHHPDLRGGIRFADPAALSAFVRVLLGCRKDAPRPLPVTRAPGGAGAALQC